MNTFANKEGFVRIVAKRALFVVNSFGGGGAESVCITLACALERRGYICEFITLDGERDHEVPPSFVVHSLVGVGGKVSGSILRRIILFNRMMKRQRGMKSYDLITAHLPAAHLVVRFSPLSFKAGYVVHGSQKLSPYSRLPFYGFLLRRMLAGRKVVAVSEGIGKELTQKYRLADKSVTVIYNPISGFVFEKKAPEDCFSSAGPVKNERPYLLVVGRLVKTKRIDRAIEVFFEGRFYERYDLYIAGEGECASDLKSLVADLGMTNFVKFLGFVNDPCFYMKRAEIVLSTSDSESLGQAIIESLAIKTKVVSSDCDYGPREIMTGGLSSYLVKPVDDIDAYICAINKALVSYPALPPDSLSIFSEERASRAYEQLLTN